MKNAAKRLTAFILTIIMLFGTFILTSAQEQAENTNTTESTENTDEGNGNETEEVTYELGDVDKNGKVSASDARAVLRAAASLEKLSDEAMKLADYNKDSAVNAADARCILRHAAKLDPFGKDPVKEPEKEPVKEPEKPKELTFADRKFTVEASYLFSAKYAKYACLYDYDNDKILYGKNMHSRCHPASTTKVITAALACEYLSADYILTVGSELDLVHWNTSRSGLYKGQKIKFSEILKCLLVPSGCDAAYTIAAHTARVATGDKNMSASKAIKTFVSMMNQYAKKLGMNDSHFMNPDGFPDSNHYVSAYDMVIITTKAYSFKLIRNVVSQPWATAYFVSGGSYSYSNSNETINPYSARYYPYMVGVKTGSHSQAGQCLVTVAQKKIEQTGKTKTFVATVYSCPNKDGRYLDLKSLYNTAFSYFWRQP